MVNHTDWAGGCSGNTADFCGRCLVEIPSKTPAVLTEFLLIFLSPSSHTWDSGTGGSWWFVLTSYYVAGFTGVDQEYEKPETPDLVVKTVDCTVEESMLQVVELLEEHVSAAIWD